MSSYNPRFRLDNDPQLKIQGEKPEDLREDNHPSGELRLSAQDQNLKELSFWRYNFEEAAEGRDSHQSPLRFALIIVGLTMVSVLVWFGFQWVTAPSSSTPPLITAANPGSYRVKPDSPGGMAIPHQDKLIYDRLTDNKEEPVVESLLETPTEEPMILNEPQQGAVISGDIQDPLASQQPVDQGQGVIQGDIVLPPEPVDVPNTAAPTSHPKVTTPPPPPVQKAYLQVEKKKSAKGASKAAAKAATKGVKDKKTQKKAPAPAVAAAGKHYIQLASLESPNQAKQEWKRLTSRHKDILGKLKPAITKAELDGGRVFYRLRTGSFSRDKALDLCKKLRGRKVGCLVINP